MSKIYKSVQPCTTITSVFNPASFYAGEKFLLLILVSIGISGFVYVSQNPIYKDKTDRFSKVNTYQTLIASTPTLEYESSTDTDPKSNSKTINQLHISGIPASNENLTFEFNAFHKNAAYRIDFGNGISKNITDKTIQYSYPTAGTFPLKLIAFYNGETKILHQEKLEIRN